MDNIVYTFNINKEIINEDNLLKIKIEDDNNDDKSLDIIVKKKKLIEMACNLTNIEYYEILNIIQDNNCNYSSNANGVFINLLNVEDCIIDKIYNFLKFTKHKKDELQEKENYLEKFKNTFNNDEKITNIYEQSDEKDDKSIESLSDNNDNIDYNDYLCFSSDDEDNKVLKNKKK